MATNYPTSIDSFTNPTSGDTLDSPSHAAQHANINDAMVAVQTKLGVGSGTIGTWTTYTPTFGSPLSIGNATIDFRYSVLNDIVFVDGTILFGSTTAVTGVGAPAVSLPVNNAYASGINRKIGYGQINETGVATWDLWPMAVNATQVLLFCSNSSFTYLRESGIGPAFPVSSWAAGDSIHMTLTYRAA